MDNHFSRYLDLTRFTAAVLVVLAHFVQYGIIGVTPPGTLPDLGREAVIVFFLLSGFVIAYTSATKPLTLRQYVVARSARIYSVAIPVVLLCFVVAGVAAQLGSLPAEDAYQFHKLYVYLPLHLLFAGELWTLSEVPPWLPQYWSLGYEVWYYVLFGVAFYLRGRTRVCAVALVLLIMGPKLWLLLPIWLAGVYLYRYQKDLPLSQRQARLAWCATLVLLGLYKYLGLDQSLRTLGSALWPFPNLHLGSAERYLADYVVCVLIYLNFVLARQAGFPSLQAWDRSIRALSTYTFTLYLIHGPVIALWNLYYPHQANSVRDMLLLCAAIAGATWLAGQVTERRKQWFHLHIDSATLLCMRRFA
ncbi:MAG: acyltransferase family protein [Massilia sp.]